MVNGNHDIEEMAKDEPPKYGSTELDEAMLNNDEAPHEGLEEIRKHEECID